MIFKMLACTSASLKDGIAAACTAGAGVTAGAAGADTAACITGATAAADGATVDGTFPPAFASTNLMQWRMVG